MEYYWIIVFFLFGTILGSFYNVVGLRLPKDVSFHEGRSFCPNCKRQLKALELIPLLSFIIQRGACRHCREKISFIYPTIELLTGGLFAYSYIHFGFSWELITSLLLISMAMILVVTDLSYMLIPNKILLFFLPLFILMRTIQPLEPWYDSIVGGVVGFSLIMIIILASQGGMGAGDMKLFGVLGIVLGWKLTLLTLFIAALLGALIGGLLIATKVISRKQPIPFGPYIIVGTFISYYFGEQFLTYYLTLL